MGIPFRKRTSDFYCGVGPNNVSTNTRKFAEQLLENCLYAELTTTGFNFEVAPAQCEFQIFGKGLDAADQLLLFRYIALILLNKITYLSIFIPNLWMAIGMVLVVIPIFLLEI